MQTLFNFISLVPKLAPDDYVGFTFFVGCMAMMAAAAFFFLSMNDFDKKWKTSILVSGLITFIAAVHYWYMRDYWATNMESPTFFRYVDWILTVPLMCVEFYLILKVAGAKKSLMWRLIFLSVIMLVTGYIGEGVDQNLQKKLADRFKVLTKSYAGLYWLDGLSILSVTWLVPKVGIQVFLEV